MLSTTLAPGGERPSSKDEKADEFEANAFHMNEGKRLFGWFNCAGCHANGGGGMGPPLMDEKWIYGSSIGGDPCHHPRRSSQRHASFSRAHSR